MVKIPDNEYFPTEVSPPGASLADILAERGLTQADLADRMGRPRKTINEIIQGKAMITPETALQLELVLGAPAEFWLAREQNYRTFLARRDQMERIERDVKWARNFPWPAMAKLGWVEATRNSAQRARALLQFFGIASSAQWSREAASVATFRKSARFKVDSFALTAWLRAGEIVAQQTSVAPYNREAFLNKLSKIRTLTTEPPEVFRPEIEARCARAGLVVAFVPTLPKSRASGATRWVTPDRALIQLSLRYKSDDQLWFTFFHEAAHVLQGKKRTLFIRDNGTDRDTRSEQQADQWAASFLIPPAQYNRFTASGDFSKKSIISFAEELGIAPGIVVGRLQHDKWIPYTFCNQLKKRLVWVQ